MTYLPLPFLKNKSKKQIILLSIGLLLALGILVGLCIWLIPLILSLKEPEKQAAFRSFVDSLGVFGVLFMLAIQILQIVVAVIPGEPIELLMGIMYGTIPGLLLTLLGILIGTALVYYLVKKLGMNFVNKFVNSESFRKYSFLHDPTKRDLIIFILFLIPGTPKDVLTYFVPFTDIPFLRFLVIATVARIPSVISSTWVGASLSEGALVKSVIIYAATGLIGLVGILINNQFLAKKNQTHEENHS